MSLAGRIAAAVAGLVSGTAGQAAVPAVGDAVVCGAIRAVVGRVETWRDVLGDLAAEAVADDVIVHAQLVPESGPLVGHAPFALSALGGCRPAEAPVLDEAEFDEGYALWQRAAMDDGAGVWSLRPDAAYEAITELLDRTKGETE